MAKDWLGLLDLVLLLVARVSSTFLLNIDILYIEFQKKETL